MTDSDWVDEEIEIVTLELEELVLARDWHLRAPWDGRLCNECAWHKETERLNERINFLRSVRRELLFERAEVW